MCEQWEVCSVSVNVVLYVLLWLAFAVGGINYVTGAVVFAKWLTSERPRWFVATLVLFLIGPLPFLATYWLPWLISR